MADTHEEQLLSGLLRDVAREDAGLDAAHLEARVLASMSAQVMRAPRRVHFWMAAPVAAILLLAVAVSFRPRPNITTAESADGLDPGGATTPAQIQVAPLPSPTVRQEPKPARPASRVRAQPDRSLQSVEPPEPAPIIESPLATTAIEFVPLMPMTEQELTGSFQIVRVQLPSASLGPLRSPIDHPSKLVEADVLLGEDGRARAIRINSNMSGSIYPWRSR